MLIDGWTAVAMLVMLYVALITYAVIANARKLRRLQERIEAYESAAAFAQANDRKDALEIRNHVTPGNNPERLESSDTS